MEESGHTFVGGFVCHTCTVRICEARLSTSRCTCLYSALSAFMQRPAKCPWTSAAAKCPWSSVVASQSAPQPRTPGSWLLPGGSHLLGHTHRRSCSGCGGRAQPHLTRLQLRRHLLLPSSTASTEQRAQRYNGSGSSSLSSTVEARRCQRLLPVATACGLLAAVAACDLLANYVCCMRCRFSHLQQISRTVSVTGTPSGTTCSYTTR